MIYIYALCDPKTNEVRYIGKSINPKQRYTNHLNDRSKTHKVNWIKSLKNKGLKPTLIILDELNDGDDWQKAEIGWIKTAKEKGWDLVNCTDGGDGVLNLSGDGYERMKKTWIGRKHKPETLIRLSKASKGRKKTPAQKDYMRKLMTGRVNTWGDKVSISMRKFDDEKISCVLKDLETMKVIDVAEKYNVHRTTITKIKLGKYPN